MSKTKDRKKHVEAILRYLENRRPPGRRLKARRLARKMGISEQEYGDFRAAFKQLRDSGKLLIGGGGSLTLPASHTLVGRFRAHPRGFGFVVPDEPDSHGDLFIPPDRTGGAMNGDLVAARIVRRRGDERRTGEIAEIRERGMTRAVGTLEESDGHWFVLPDGRVPVPPVLVRDVPAEAHPPGTKVVVDLIDYPEGDGLPAGVIAEKLGASGEPRVEIAAVARSHGLREGFSDQACEQARRAALEFDPADADDREDLRGTTIVTIDPETARDYDDAISIEREQGGGWTLGVHIADVAHFVPEGSLLDREARQRGTSVYFPRRVLPMLPETLSGGVCSLQEGVDRFAKSVFVRYDREGNVLGREIAETLIRSSARLTYEQAQRICDGDGRGFPRPIVELVREMERLARRVEARREREGMLHLDLPEVELVLDEEGAVVDAAPADQSYSHTIIEMFMVEANEAVAAAFAVLGEPLIRRVHPPPDDSSFDELRAFVGACGHRLPRKPRPRDLQRLVADARGRPESYAVNLAVLRSLQRAVYAPGPEGHFALGSRHYCHFTSPIRRYPDLTVHRALARYLRGEIGDDLERKGKRRGEAGGLTELAKQLSSCERTAEAAERELRMVLILQHLAGRVGETFEGVISGVADFGVFVQSPRFLVEGLVRLPDLGDDWWDVIANSGEVRGRVSGRRHRLGNTLSVRIASVDVARRELELVSETDRSRPRPRPRRRKPPRSTPPRRRSAESRKARRPRSSSIRRK